METNTNLIRKIVSDGRRLDGRAFDEYRKAEIETGFIGSAEGSARVRMGKTEVIIGIKMGIGVPYPDSPDQGVLSVSAELVPLASPEFERGPPGEASIELARVVDRAIRESKCIDFRELCIEPGKAVWIVNVDIEVLDNDGNLIDASCLAAVAALATSGMPEMEKTGDEHKIKPGTKAGPLPVTCLPVSTTFVKIGKSIIADPTDDELGAIDARLTIGTLDSGNEIMLCSMQKGGERGLTLEETEKIIDLAVEKGKELRELVRKHAEL